MENNLCRKFSRAIIPLAGLIFLAGCSSNGDVSTLGSPSVAVDASQPTTALPSRFSATQGDYRIASDDILQIFVFQVNDFNREVQVDGAGNIVLPLLGSIPVAGRTARETESELTRRLKARYLQNPQVSVNVKDAIGQRVTISGAVQKTGVFPVRGSVTLLSMIALAGGFTEVADQSAVSIVRNTQSGRATYRFDAGAIKSGSLPDPPVFGSDMIVVDDSSTKTAWKQVREILPVAGAARVFF